MDSMILTFSFLAAIAIAACVVVLFSKSIDEALFRVIPAELAPAWRQYAKFALFTVTLAGGMRLKELEEFVAMRAPAGPPLTAGQGLLEIFKSIGGSLVAASATLLVFFVATLAIDASMRLFWLQRAKEAKAPAQPVRPPVKTERQPVGSERHAASKERQRSDEPGRFL